MKAIFMTVVLLSAMIMILFLWQVRQEFRLNTLEGHDQRLKEHVEQIEWYLTQDELKAAGEEIR